MKIGKDVITKKPKVKPPIKPEKEEERKAFLKWREAKKREEEEIEGKKLPQPPIPGEKPHEPTHEEYAEIFEGMAKMKAGKKPAPRSRGTSPASPPAAAAEEEEDEEEK